MPLELGLFLGCRRFGGERQRSKVWLILDREPYRYRQFISDISGQDIHSHGNEYPKAIIEVRNWLASASKRKGLPGGAEIVDRYERFLRELPVLCKSFRRQPEELTFGDLSEMIDGWFQVNR